MRGNGLLEDSGAGGLGGVVFETDACDARESAFEFGDFGDSVLEEDLDLSSCSFHHYHRIIHR